MLRLPRFEYHQPEGLDAALALLARLVAADAQVALIAGGTDLLPNMKHEIATPGHLVSLARCDLVGCSVVEGQVQIGAMTPVQTVAEDATVRQALPGLAEACEGIAGPQLRRMGTLGGNICLDTRCLFINQTHFWRQSLGYCLKKDGTSCHVVEGGRRCVAAASNDSVLPLILYGAQVCLSSLRGERVVALDEFFVADGVNNTVLEPDEILTRVLIPVPDASTAVAFEKLRMRKAIDFALCNAAVCVRGPRDNLEGLSVVVGALGARPKRMNFDKLVAGQPLHETLIARIADKARASCKPLTSIATDANWRRQMIGVLIERALTRLQSG